jgi:hypothetical protein
VYCTREVARAVGCDIPLKKSQNSGFDGKLFLLSAKIFDWYQLKSNSYSKNFDKFTKNVTNYGTLTGK